MADMLFEAGVDDKSQARQLFASAEAAIPVLNVLASRHADPDDTFDLNEFVESEVMADPTQKRRVRRLLAQERSTFSMGGGGAEPFAPDRSGRKAGLETR